MPGTAQELDILPKAPLTSSHPPEPKLSGAGATTAQAVRRLSVSTANASSPASMAPPSSEPSSPSKSSKAHNLKAFVDDDRHFSLRRNFRLADCVTLMNGVCGSLSLFESANWLLTGDYNHLWAALTLPAAGMVFDLFDGKVARWRNEASMLGQELDSLADSISFGVAPAFCAFSIGLRTPGDIFILCGFICSGIARLARFNATVALIPKDKKGKSRYFEGLPIPSTLMLVAGMGYLVKHNKIEGPLKLGSGLPGGLIRPLQEAGLEVHWASLIFILWGTLMVSKSLHVP
ncbi:uncharacterized protein L969DRAFT_75987 [Mixia osmundae IAM 14324]|uniref:uncharacterized protein n=1 Tax=Mixia osmundae (strain CBS 9802 / IAM 14324 / JCM 22182 / KY 12970) TaxID=764103 RepID=UPI0004A5502F|nr:uncharacterized protein L969DRAFT_75987 [Mixia osmundae IAM 14324]KEI39068.1 hypothetical protein L969DRAFT_75987 [Mixia osmundae IAM 14324]